MTTTNTEAGAVADVAAKLTEAQRRMVLTDSSRFANNHVGKWHGHTTRTAAALFDLGLIERLDTLSYPTPLGLAVRQHLEQGATAGVLGGKERGDG